MQRRTLRSYTEFLPPLGSLAGSTSSNALRTFKENSTFIKSSSATESEKMYRKFS
ncbi:hypothetical protein GCM10007362_01200 [Saccharibacillus endophyticus]|uniref:Uncharacterized protein n=1 Tax=Saccharibacillus endophyticus TaxID=2060666 RepID=A0ABQ1ZL21_9BACL|nr:hypothetical protein GCM10007362_01200 [Saccharibacillus endophyticus]